MCSELRENPSNILVTHSHFVKIEYSIRVFHQHIPQQSLTPIPIFPAFRIYAAEICSKICPFGVIATAAFIKGIIAISKHIKWFTTEVAYAFAAFLTEPRLFTVLVLPPGTVNHRTGEERLFTPGGKIQIGASKQAFPGAEIRITHVVGLIE